MLDPTILNNFFNEDDKKEMFLDTSESQIHYGLLINLLAHSDPDLTKDEKLAVKTIVEKTIKECLNPKIAIYSVINLIEYIWEDFTMSQDNCSQDKKENKNV